MGLNALDVIPRFEGLTLDECVIANLGAGKSDSPISSQLPKIVCKQWVHVEGFAPYLPTLRAHDWKRGVEVCNEDILSWIGAQPRQSVDVSLVIDVLEHFPKLWAGALLHQLLRVTKQRILIWIPFGICPQGDNDGNRLQIHLSTWFPPDLEDHGFTVETYPSFHKHFDPPVDAGWATLNL